ncbi:MAG: GTP 3',8-cyclase MoaA [Armatimonadetes bacterium]|nr:GTP 3',8-cyclase MoaA [Armatimonadota bacterium]
MDRFGRFHDYLRISITDRCNFRCTYCMPEKGVKWKPRDEILTFEEIVQLVTFFAKKGVRKLRITGGEPTIRHGYIDLIRELRTNPAIEELALTTNGSRLSKDAPFLKEAGLSSINVSLDTLRADRFEAITRRSELELVLKGIEFSQAHDIPTKVNVVMMPGVNDDEIIDFVHFASSKCITVRFIEFMPFLNNNWSSCSVLSSSKIREIIGKEFQLQALDGYPSDVAREYSIPGSAGRIAFVSSVTESFCGGCSRLRLTADGELKSCLFLPPAVSLRDILRYNGTDDELEQAVATCLAGKWAGHPPMRDWAQRDHLTMVQIGG